MSALARPIVVVAIRKRMVSPCRPSSSAISSDAIGGRAKGRYGRVPSSASSEVDFAGLLDGLIGRSLSDALSIAVGLIGCLATAYFSKVTHKWNQFGTSVGPINRRRSPRASWGIEPLRPEASAFG